MTRTFAIAAIALLATAANAFAHAQLEKAIPAVGATVTTPPTELRLKFSEGVEVRFTGVTLTDAAGTAEELGPATTDPSDKSLLIVKIKAALKPGAYTVTWHAVSVDTHKTQGQFMFTVAP